MRTEAAEFARMPEKTDKLAQLFLSFIGAGHISKSGPLCATRCAPTYPGGGSSQPSNVRTVTLRRIAEDALRLRLPPSGSRLFSRNARSIVAALMGNKPLRTHQTRCVIPLPPPSLTNAPKLRATTRFSQSNWNDRTGLYPAIQALKQRNGNLKILLSIGGCITMIGDGTPNPGNPHPYGPYIDMAFSSTRFVPCLRNSISSSVAQ